MTKTIILNTSVDRVLFRAHQQNREVRMWFSAYDGLVGVYHLRGNCWVAVTNGNKPGEVWLYRALAPALAPVK